MSNITYLDCTNSAKELYGQVRNEQIALCDILEDIADSLPHNVDKQICNHTAIVLNSIIKRAHKTEQNILFPYIKDNAPSAIDLTKTFARLKKQHLRDQYSGEELSEILLSYAISKPSHSAETTGYIIRAYFESLRRHIAFVDELISPTFDQ